MFDYISNSELKTRRVAEWFWTKFEVIDIIVMKHVLECLIYNFSNKTHFEGEIKGAKYEDCLI